MNFLNIIKKGTYYYPALKHYDLDDGNIICDRCNRNNIPACIGYNDKDLCMECVNDIISFEKTKTTSEVHVKAKTKTKSKDKLKSKMRQSMFKSMPKKMKQNMFKK